MLGQDGYHPPRQPPKSSRRKQLYATWQPCPHAGKVPAPIPTAAVPIWLPSSLASAHSGDTHIFCFIEKTDIIRHMCSRFSSLTTCNHTHPFLLVSWRAITVLLSPSLPPSGPALQYKDAEPQLLSLHRLARCHDTSGSHLKLHKTMGKFPILCVSGFSSVQRGDACLSDCFSE